MLIPRQDPGSLLKAIPTNCAPLRSGRFGKKKEPRPKTGFLLPAERLELSRCRHRRILSPKLGCTLLCQKISYCKFLVNYVSTGT